MKRLSKFINWNNRSLQIKLVTMFALTLGFIVAINVVMLVNVNMMVNRLESIYVSNLNLDGLLGALEDVHASMTEYLDTKSSDSLEQYYRADQTYRGYMDTLNQDTSSDPMLLAEKNIYNLSDSYLAIVEETVNAKRGRDVEQYSSYYERANEAYKSVETFIYSLNNERFRANNSDYSVLLTSLRYLEGVNIAVLTLASVLELIMMNFFTVNLIRPLKELSEAARRVSEGDFDVEVGETDSEDEIGILSKTFAQMLESIRLNIERVRESALKESAMKEKELMMEAQMKDAQLKYLQAQINPHFLFNTLNAGAQLATLEGADKTAVFIDRMASFFRYNISRPDEDSTIGEELGMVDDYIYILNVRFSGEIHYSKSIDEALTHIRVPSMILQPIVENAVNYGIRDIDRTKIIEVTCARSHEDDDFYELCVWDNGKGMSREKIDTILSGEYGQDPSEHTSNGVGLSNVMARLKLYFNMDGLFDIRSDGVDHGTEVIIRIPVNE